MKLIAYLSSLGIRQRVMILALMPATLIALVISGYLITTQLEQERNDLFNDSHSLVRFLAAGSEFAFFTNNTEMLQSLSRSLRTQPDIDNALFISSNGDVLYQSHPGPVDMEPLFALADKVIPSGPIMLAEGQYAFGAPVITSELAIEDFEQTSTQAEQLGRVYLIVNDGPLKTRQKTIFMRGLGITLFGVSLTLWLAVAIGRSIFNPIQKIIATVDSLNRDQMNARAETRSSGEIGELAQGINKLAERVQLTRERLEDEITLATDELQATLNRLEIKNEDLEQARVKAEQANQAKDAFLARMSHELRTPLTSVLGFIRLLRQTPLDREQAEFGTIIQRTSSLLLALIDDILDFSKLQSKAIRLEHIEFSLVDCIEDILEMQTPIAHEKQIDIQFISDPELPERLMGDPTRVGQVISNLISNAVKFTENGEVVVRLQRGQAQGRQHLEVSVEDTGIGIQPDQLQRLFQPFTQADTSITRRFGGSGLGLVICKQLVDMMGGKIEMQSLPNQGTTSRISLPLDTADTPALPARFEGLHIQGYDRHPAAQKSICDLLEKWGCIAQCHDDLSQLIVALQSTRQPVDRVVLSLSDGDVMDLDSVYIATLRQHYAGDIILVTHHSQVPDPETLAQLAPVTLIHKPMTRRKLLQAFTAGQPLADSPQHPLDSQPLAGINLLVAEDNQFNRLLLQKMLEQFGATVSLAVNGQQAVEQANRGNHDVILMDVHMPVMDGIEASHHIRQLPGAAADTPIVALTANVISNEQDELLQAGVNKILFKPINERQMVGCIQEVCKRQGKADALACDDALEDHSTRLSEYGITESSLHDELQSQVQAIHQAFLDNQPERMRDHSHQLMGLAGLLDLVELEAATFEFNDRVKNAGAREIWEYLHRLERVIDSISHDT